MAMTFTALSKYADFTGAPAPQAPAVQPPATEHTEPERTHALKLGGLVYNIQIVLPESRDPAVYDALFQSLRRHLV
jgi:hypothetical protein